MIILRHRKIFKTNAEVGGAGGLETGQRKLELLD